MPQYVQLNVPQKEDADEAKGFTKWAVWACGFRPFFFGGALAAALLIPAWLVIFFNGLLAGGPAGPIEWHAHEMIFGFAPAIIAGFLLTAVPKWTRVPVPTGGMLAVLFGLWLAGRIAMAAAGVLPYGAVAAMDLLFLPALAVAIAIPIGRSLTLRNLGFIPLLFGLAVANTLFHLDHLGVIDGWSMRAIDAAMGIVITIIAIVGGRVIPFFTANAVGLPAIDRRRIVDIAAIILTVGWLVCHLVAPTSMAVAFFALAAGIANLARMVGWGFTKSLSVPLLWVLHAGYAFVGIGLLLVGVAGLELAASRTLGIHALTTGAIGILCIGMMARVSLGHTGRKLVAHRLISIAFGLAIVAAVVRVFLPWLIPSAYFAAIVSSGVMWTGAWILFLVIYTPILLRPRADGRPG